MSGGPVSYDAEMFERVRFCGILLLPAAVAGLVQGRGQAQAVGARPDVRSQVERVFVPYQSSDSPGLAVMVRKDGKTIFERGYGVAKLKTGSPIDEHTDFRLASCTKQFTAMSIMLLVHDGKLRYEDHLTDVFPEFPAYGNKITIRNLLNHTSGLPDYEELMDRAEAAGATPWTRERQIQAAEVLKLLEAEKSGRFEPGTSWSYSNSGYVVLGSVVEKVAGMPFEDFLRKRIFAPLRMDHTVAFVQGKDHVPHRALGYSREGQGFKDTDQSSTSATLGDGGIYSNLQDLAKWDNALREHTLFSAAEMQPALEPFRLPSGEFPHWSSGPGDTDPLGGKPVEYGFGWFLSPYKGHRRMWHYGDTSGFKTAIEHFPDDKLTIIVLANRTDIDAAALAEQVADIYLNRK